MFDTGCLIFDAGNRIIKCQVTSIQHQASNIQHPTSNIQHQAFTLLELLISLTIIAVIVVLMSGAFRVGIRAWEKGEQNIEANQRHRIVLDLMKRQIASACLQDMKIGGKAFFLKGDDKSITFLSRKPLIPGNTFGVVYVRYAAVPGEDEGERLMLYEKNLVLLDKAFDADNPNEDEFHELLPGIHSILFEYLKKGDETVEWQPSWDLEDDKGFPLAIRISLRKDSESAPVLVIARILN